MKKTIETFGPKFRQYSIIFAILTLIICFFPFMFSRNAIDWFGISFTQETGFVGDTIGGTMGPFVAIIAAALTFLAFWIQFKANEQQRLDLEFQIERGKIEKFEQAFIEMIKIHRDNVNEMKYEKPNTKGSDLHEGRRVPIIIFREFIECSEDIEFFFQSTNPDDYLHTDYSLELTKIISKNSIKASIMDMVKIDLSYSIIYFGVGKEGLMSLKHNFSKKYHNSFFEPILDFLSTKPKKDDNKNYKKWEMLAKSLTRVNQNKAPHLLVITNEISDFMIKNSKEINIFKKYYGGHQHRLGHYFRHLFQCYKYLDSQIELKLPEKYQLGKMLRAQISTYEQAIILINSISSLGMRWEFNPKEPITQMLNSSNGKLITTYQVIKNLPGIHLYDIKFDDFYPNIEYEFSNK